MVIKNNKNIFKKEYTHQFINLLNQKIWKYASSKVALSLLSQDNHPEAGFEPRTFRVPGSDHTNVATFWRTRFGAQTKPK